MVSAMFFFLIFLLPEVFGASVDNTSHMGASLPVATSPMSQLRVGALATWFVTQRKTMFIPAGVGCPSSVLASYQPMVNIGPMQYHGPRYTCIVNPLHAIFLSENNLGEPYKCKEFSSKLGCERGAFWWNIQVMWASELSNMGITVDDIRLNRKVTMSAKQFSNMLRLFWKLFHVGSLPPESSVVHSLHGHRMPSGHLSLPRVTRGGGGFGGPVWHQREDPCIADTLDIIFHGSNKIPRPCKPITYDGSGFYVDNDRLTSTYFYPDCEHTCGFRYYYGNVARGQIIAYKTTTSKLKVRHEIEGAILDHL